MSICFKSFNLIGEVENDPWGLAFKIVTKGLATRRNTPGLDNPERVNYIVRSLFPHVKPFQRQERSSCVVRREELSTHEELKRAVGRIKANIALSVDGVSNEILKEVIGAYPEILLEAFNSCLWEGRFFVDWKKQRLVLLRKGNHSSGEVDSTPASGSVGRGERSIGKPVRIPERQVHWTLSNLWLTSLQMQEMELVSVRDSAR